MSPAAAPEQGPDAGRPGGDRSHGLSRFADSGDPADPTCIVHLRGAAPPHDRGEIRGPLPEVLRLDGITYCLSAYRHREPDGALARSYYPYTEALPGDRRGGAPA